MEQLLNNKSFIPLSNLALLVISFFFNVYQYRESRKEKLSTEIAYHLIQHFFLPFQNKLGIYLFQKITEENWSDRRKIFLEFQTILISTKEAYYLSDRFILSFRSLEKYLTTEVLSNQDLKSINKIFYRFSRIYLEEHNEFREAIHLLPKKKMHRLRYRLYGNKGQMILLCIQYFFFVLYLLVFLLLIIFIMIYFMLLFFEFFYF